MKRRKVSHRTNGAVPAFDARAFLDSSGLANKVAEYGRGETVFTQGDACDHVMYIQSGGVKLSVLSKSGREAVVAMLGPGDFFGEGCLAGQPLRMGSATAITPSVILCVGKEKMIRLLHQQHAMSDRFISHMLSRNIRIEAGPDRSALQLQREAAGAHAAAAGALRQAGQADPRRAEDLAGDAREDDRHDPLAREFLPEQVQEAGVHRVRRRVSRSRSTARC